MKNQYCYRIPLLFFFLTIILNFSFSQSEDFTLISKKGIAYSNAGVKIRFKSVEQKENTFVFTTTNRTNVEVTKSNVAQINLQKGNYAGRYAVVGALIPSVTMGTLLAWESKTKESYPGEEIIALILVSISASIGAIIGALIGSTQKKYKTIYNAPSIGYTSPKFQLKTTTPNSIPSLTISYSF